LSEAFVTSSLVFCVGPLTILGSLDNGLSGDPTKLVIKSTLDGFAALAFGATLGWGVLLSVFTILIFQSAISLGAGALAPVLGSGSEALIELTATGGLILIAIGLRLLKIRELRTANFLPALVVAPLLVMAHDYAVQRVSLGPLCESLAKPTQKFKYRGVHFRRALLLNPMAAVSSSLIPFFGSANGICFHLPRTRI